MKARADGDELSLAQQSAIDLLAAGRNDTEAAAVLGVSRVTVTRWRLYSPAFRAALAERRAAVWGAAADRLRALVPKAIDALAEALDTADEADRVTVALAVLKLAGPLPLTPPEPPDADEIVRAQVERERELMRDRSSDTLDTLDGLPDYDSHTRGVRKRLAALAGPSDPSPALPALSGGDGAAAE